MKMTKIIVAIDIGSKRTALLLMKCKMSFFDLILSIEGNNTKPLSTKKKSTLEYKDENISYW